MSDTPIEDMVAQLDILIPAGTELSLTALAAEFLTAHNEGLRHGTDPNKVTLRRVSVDEHGNVTLTFTGELIEKVAPVEINPPLSDRGYDSAEGDPSSDQGGE